MSKLESKSIKEKEMKSAKAEFADFKIIEEEWDLHKLHDGSLLRSRVILTGVLLHEKDLKKIIGKIEAGQEPLHGMTFRAKHFFEVEPLSSLRGSPDRKSYPISELRSCIVDEDIDFRTTRQSWNVYELENGIKIKLRLSVTSISRTSKFDSYGMPIYIIDSNIEGKTEIPDSWQNLSKGKKMKMHIEKQ